MFILCCITFLNRNKSCVDLFSLPPSPSPDYVDHRFNILCKLEIVYNCSLVNEFPLDVFAHACRSLATQFLHSIYVSLVRFANIKSKWTSCKWNAFLIYRIAIIYFPRSRYFRIRATIISLMRSILNWIASICIIWSV